MGAVKPGRHSSLVRRRRGLGRLGGPQDDLRPDGAVPLAEKRLEAWWVVFPVVTLRRSWAAEHTPGSPPETFPNCSQLAMFETLQS